MKIRTKKPDSQSIAYVQYFENKYGVDFISKFIKFPGVGVKLRAEANSFVYIKDMLARHPGQGAGSNALQELCVKADEMMIYLKLYAYPYGDTTLNQLINFYQSFEFDILNGDEEGITMVREPQ